MSDARDDKNSLADELERAAQASAPISPTLVMRAADALRPRERSPAPTEPDSATIIREVNESYREAARSHELEKPFDLNLGPRPSDEEVERVAAWLEKVGATFDPVGPEYVTAAKMLRTLYGWIMRGDSACAALEQVVLETMPSATPCIEDGPFKGLPKPVKVPEGYVMVDEKSFKIILGVLTEEQTREICMKEGERLYLNRADGGRQTT